MSWLLTALPKFGQSSVHKKQAFLVLLLMQFSAFAVLSSKKAPIAVIEVTAHSTSYVTCQCDHPASVKRGENGFQCSDPSHNGYCESHKACVAVRGEVWNFGEFPCETTIACECSHPGSLLGGENGFQCSDPSYNGYCETGNVCLTPRGHVWDVDKVPCGPKHLVQHFRKYGAYTEISLRSPCSRTIVGIDEGNAHLCASYETLKLVVPDCSRRPIVVPRILHSVGRRANQYIESSVAVSNPSYMRKRQDDQSAAEYIFEQCGKQVAQAYACLSPASYRADLFRFCALYAEGGVYLDEDIVPLRPLEEIISQCSVATIGHDFPTDGRDAKQMKILASAPLAPIMKCAMDTIVNNVRDRARPESPLELTGPLMLQECYARHSGDVAVTYIDTRNAIWPYTGMRAGNQILAYEYPDSPKHFCFGKQCSATDDYATLYKDKKVYTDNCELG